MRYFFDLRSAQGVTQDCEGVELADTAAVRQEAHDGAVEMLKLAIARGERLHGHSFVVRDEHGQVALIYDVMDAQQLC